MPNVVIAGYGKMFTNIIAGTLDAGYKIVGVYRYDYVKTNRFIRFIKDMFNPTKELSYIKSLGLKEIKCRSINSEEFKKLLIKNDVDMVFTASWGEKIKKEVFTIPKMGFINVHPSLLPKYRGPNPYLGTILNQEQVSGVTFHLVDEKWDNGAIIMQRKVKIHPDDTGEELRERTTLQARGAVYELLTVLKTEIIVPVNQNEEESSYFSLKDLDNGIDFKTDAKSIKCKIQAFHPWKECYAEFEEGYIVPEPYGIFISNNTSEYKEAGTIVEINNKRGIVSVLCGDNKVITLRCKNKNKFRNLFNKTILPANYRIGKLFHYSVIE